MTGDTDLFGKYRLKHLIGRGAYSTVFRAEYQGGYGFRKPVALKVMRRRLSSVDEPASQEFLNEARLGAAIQHPNLVEFYECGRVGDRLYIAMELVPGPNLAEVIRIAPSLGLQLEDEFVLTVAHQTARGLAALHSAQVEGSRIWAIHRDLKPGNILLSPAGHAKITDYGIARYATDAYETVRSDGPLGSPLYMSPEQTRGEAVTQASDTFSFGTTILELINLRPVFGSTTIEGVVRKVGEVDASDALIAARSRFPQLVPVLEDCLLSDPAKRYRDGPALVEALKAIEPPAFAEEVVSGIGAEVQRAVEFQREEIRRKPVRQFWSRLSDADEDSVSISLDLMSSDTAGVQPNNLAAQAGSAAVAVQGDEPIARRPWTPWIPWLVAAVALVGIALLLGPRLGGSGGTTVATPGAPDPAAPHGHTPSVATPPLPVVEGTVESDEGTFESPPAEAPSPDLTSRTEGNDPEPTAAASAVSPPAASSPPALSMSPVSRGIRGQVTQIDVRVSPAGRHPVMLWYRSAPDGNWQTDRVTSDATGAAALTIPVGSWLPQDCRDVDYFVEVSWSAGLVRSGSAAHPHRLTLY